MNIGFDREERFIASAIRFGEFNTGVRAGLEPDDFTNLHCRAIWQAALKIGEDDGSSAVDLVSVGEELARHGLLFTVDFGGLLSRLDVLDIVQSGGTGAAAALDAGKIREAGLTRRAAESGDQVIHDARTGEARPDELRDWASGIARSLSTQEIRPVSVHDAALAFVDRAVERRVIRTGIKGLDQIIGGFPRGSLVVVAGPTSHGKSVIMADMARAAGLRQERVALFSVEMTADETAARDLSSLTGISTEALLRGERDEAWWPRIVAALAALSAMRVDVYTTPALTLEDICAAIEIAQEPYDLVIVDYLQIMIPPKAQSRNDAIGAITAGLKRLAMQIDGVVVIGSQLSRGSQKDNREPALFDLRDSGSIEQDANMVLFVHRPDPTQTGRNLIVAKNRNGREGRMELPFWPERVSFIPPAVA